MNYNSRFSIFTGVVRTASAVRRKIAVGFMVWPSGALRSGMICGLAFLLAQTFPTKEGRAVAQTDLSFEVASIRRGAPNGPSVMDIKGNSFTATGMSLKTLITMAYDTRSFMVSGGPRWIDTSRYDVRAKSADSFEKAGAQESFRPLLRRETKHRGGKAPD